jgi:coproporphyrinogen III oxidase
VRTQFIDFIHDLQDRICAALEASDAQARFVEDKWVREGGGGGRTRVIAEGAVFEKGGVNTSVVHGELPELIRQRFGVQQGWFMAAGISLVIHPRSPFVPTVHANYRYFELYDSADALKSLAESGNEQSATDFAGSPDVRDSWFGGGADLTPYYLDRDDARHFHAVHRQACDTIDARLYPKFKTDCDAYFHNAHRGESRGIGGIFYDYLRPAEGAAGGGHGASPEGAAGGGHGASQGAPSQTYDQSPGTSHGAAPVLTGAQLLDLARHNGQAFIDAYIPVVEKNKHRSWSDSERYWQELRRGRYVEFNLIHDRGTLFGLKTNGRVESILMSLPPRVRWDYDAGPKPGSPEESLLEVLRNPVAW